MANKTKNDVLLQVYEYVPQINQTGKATMLGNILDSVVEDMSIRHDFRCFRAAQPDTATLSAGSYTLDLTAWPTMGAASTPFKDILVMAWTKSGSSDYAFITFMDDKQFHHENGYFDYSARTRGKPNRYTRMGDTFVFDCPADEKLLIRTFYQKCHGTFTGTGMSHLFPSRDNMLAFNAMVYGVIKEVKASLNTVEFPQELATAEQKYEMFLSQLIARDRDVSNEEIEVNWAEAVSPPANQRDPYDWT